MEPMSWRTKTGVLLTAIIVGPILLLWLLGFADVRALWVALLLLPVAAALTARLTMPLHELTMTARRLRGGDLAARPGARLEHPWQRVAETMIDLAEQLDTVSTDLERQVEERTAELDRKASQLRALGQVGQQVASVLEPSELLHFVVRLVRGTFGYDLVAVIQEREAHLIVAACAARGITEPPVGRVFRGDDPAVATLTRLLNVEKQATTGHDDDRDRNEPDRTAPHTITHPTTPLVANLAAQTELIMPIRLAERTLGLMVVQSLGPDAFDDDDVFTVNTIAGQVAVALENARLFDAERRLRELAITEERNRMSREIHDTLAQGFMGILMHLRALRGIDDEKAANEHRQAAETLAQQSLDEARRSVWNLRPARLHGQGLAAALQDELQRLGRQAPLTTELHLPDDRRIIDDLPPDSSAALLRIAQEALHNVAKHAKASRVRVTLHVIGGIAELRVEDDGIGFSPAESGTSDGTRRRTFGILGMRERAQSFGGSVAIESAPGAGTSVHVRLPVRKEVVL